MSFFNPTRKSDLEIEAISKGIKFSKISNILRFELMGKVICISELHSVYAFDIIRSFDYYFSAVTPIRVNNLLVIDYSRPSYHDVIGFDLMPVHFPSFAEPIATNDHYLNFSNLEKGDVILDLGAYSGLSSITMKLKVGEEGKVIAVDPDKTNCISIDKNLNLFKKITGFDIIHNGGAVWNHCEGIFFSGEGNMGSSVSEYLGERGKKCFVPTITLSELVNKYKLSRVDFIKCDIEGAETVVFTDKDFFDHFKPLIIIETHNVNGVSTVDKCTSDLTSMGYICKVVEQSGVEYPLLECTPAK
jgi:FkbM family methyltransferase